MSPLQLADGLIAQVVFTRSISPIAALGNNTLVLLEAAGIPTGFTAGTTYYVVGVSGNMFSLALTSGGGRREWLQHRHRAEVNTAGDASVLV